MSWTLIRLAFWYVVRHVRHELCLKVRVLFA